MGWRYNIAARLGRGRWEVLRNGFTMHEAPASTLLAVLGDAIRSTLEMKMKDWKPRSDWGKRLLADAKGEGEAAGEARAARRAESSTSSTCSTLAASRSTPRFAQRITACTDLDVLAQWLRRAATATAAEEVFAP
jgi:hypothetical protein